MTLERLNYCKWVTNKKQNNVKFYQTYNLSLETRSKRAVLVKTILSGVKGATLKVRYNGDSGH